MPRITGYVDDIVPAYPLAVFKESFRLSRSTFQTLKRWQRCLPDFFSGRAVETCLNPQRSSRHPSSWIFIHNILFILPLGAEWLEWCSIHSGIGIQHRKTRTFYILVILIPEFWITKRALSYDLNSFILETYKWWYVNRVSRALHYRAVLHVDMEVSAHCMQWEES